MEHVVDQAAMILKHRKVSGLFTTPKLLEALAEKMDIYEAGIRGVFCGGTTMLPQYVRFIVEEVLEGRIGFYPTYGNTLMGLAASVPLTPEDNFSITYYAPQPRAVLRVVDPERHREDGGLRHMGPRGTDHADEGILHAALPRARRSPPPQTARALRVGRRRRSAPVRRDGEDDRRRRLLKSPAANSAPTPPLPACKAVRIIHALFPPARNPNDTTTMANANDLRKGMCIRYNSNPAIVLEIMHRTPGNLRAFVQAIIRYIGTGKSADIRFGSTDKVEQVEVERKKLDFSYKDHGGYQFMDPESFETITFDESFVGGAKDYLSENQRVEVLYVEGKAASIELPSTVILTVTESADGVKGDSANNVQKPAVLETGKMITVPLFIKEGEKVKISTENGEYLGRA